jgi:glucose/arabinose dehydrogenase
VDPKKGGEILPMGSRVSRFRVLKTDPPRVDPASETVLVRWLAGGHNGGCLKFGPDGFLYITTGDAASPTPPDPLDTGQDISDLLASILRIDVDHADPGMSYAIPADNPFRDLSGARGEVWSFGSGNPWKMSFDRETGDLWVGDVGWEMWELVIGSNAGAITGGASWRGGSRSAPRPGAGPPPSSRRRSTTPTPRGPR